jgi:dihydrofolate reductase
MLWHIKEDFKHFKETTMGHTLLMGRKTFESIGRPLPGRKTFILTRDSSYKKPNCETVHSFEEAFKLARENGEDHLFIAGGGEVYKQGLQYTDQLILSHVDFTGVADAFFPEVDYSNWKKVKELNFEPTDKAPAWSLCFYQKN